MGFAVGCNVMWPPSISWNSLSVTHSSDVHDHANTSAKCGARTLSTVYGLMVTGFTHKLHLNLFNTMTWQLKFYARCCQPRHFTSANFLSISKATIWDFPSLFATLNSENPCFNNRSSAVVCNCLFRFTPNLVAEYLDEIRQTRSTKHSLFRMYPASCRTDNIHVGFILGMAVCEVWGFRGDAAEVTRIWSDVTG